MQTQEARGAAIEAGKVLDTLAALSVELSCQCDVPPDTLVLEAGKLKEACDAIDEAVASLKRILAITDPTGTSVLADGTPTKKPPTP
jgi:hypothetical protein